MREQNLHNAPPVDNDHNTPLSRLLRLAVRSFDAAAALVQLSGDEHVECWTPSLLDNDELRHFVGALEPGLEYQRFACGAPARGALDVETPTGLRFWARRAIVSGVEKKVVGTLWIFDTKERQLSAEDFSALRDLCQIIAGEMSGVEAAQLDALTGLANRRAFERAATRCVIAAQRAETPFSLIFIDMDDFKSINDTHGHAAGDRALQEMANCLRRSFRDSDTLTRFGGDEFCVLLPNATRDHAEATLRRLEARVRTFNNEKPRAFTLSFSAGVASDSIGASLDTLLRRADQAMYAAKRAKKTAENKPGRPAASVF